MADVLRRTAAAVPDQIGAELAGGPSPGTMTFGAWDARASGAGQRLLAERLGRGDRVGLLLSNAAALDWKVCYFGVHKAGGVVVPVGPRLAPPEARAILEHAGARLVIAEPRFLDRARESAPPGTRVLAAPELAAADGPPAEDPAVEVGPADLADILYTSGTTGVPKGVACTHASVTVMANRALRAFSGGGFLHAVPLYTFAGAHGMTFICLRARMTAIVMAEFDAERYLELCETRAPAAAFVVPAMGRLLLDVPARRPRDTRSVKMLMFGSAPTPASTVEGLARLFPEAHLVNIYSTTEAGGAACALPPGEALKRPGSVGVPVAPAEVRIARDDGTPAAAGEPGEVLLKSIAPPRTYYRDAEATAAAWTEDGWVRTGDVGHVDEDGFLYLVDRKKDLVIRGGFNVFTAEIDALIEAHPAVREAAVVGVPHEVLGEDLCAFVALRPGAAATAGALRAHCLARVADYKSPRRWVFLDALPRNPLGKVLKRELRARASAGEGPAPGPGPDPV